MKHLRQPYNRLTECGLDEPAVESTFEIRECDCLECLREALSWWTEEELLAGNRINSTVGSPTDKEQ